MEELLTTDYASQVVSKVNTNFGDEVITDDDSAAEVVAALNTAFDGTSGAESLSAENYAEDFIADVNTNFELYEQGGDEPEPVVTTFKLLHISDPHGTTTASTKARELANSENEGIDCVFVTGDVPTYGRNIGQTSQAQMNDFSAIGDKFFLCVGNHDVYDYLSKNGQQSATTFVKSILGQRVTWGDESGVASYWHKDFDIDGTSKLRIISLDQYELTKLNRYPGTYEYFTEYSQPQIDWLIAKLKELRASDYVFIALHESPVQSPSMPDSYATGLVDVSNPQKLFVSENLKEFGNRMNNGVAREPQLSLLPRILKAYMHKEVLVMTYNNYGGGSTPDISINEDFSQGNPATFLFWLCGHMHCDIVDYIPDESALTFGGEYGDDWSDQLLIDITAADTSVNWASEDDLGGYVNGSPPANPPQNDYTYRLNKVTLDFEGKTIRIDRIGACNTAGGRVRDTVTFPFKKN